MDYMREKLQEILNELIKNGNISCINGNSVLDDLSDIGHYLVGVVAGETLSDLPEGWPKQKD